MKQALSMIALGVAMIPVALPVHAQALVSAQAFPAKPVRIVLPVPAGGVQDTLTRGIAAELTRIWGQPMLVENRPGASGIIAAEAVARSAPDGHTIFQTDAITLNTNHFLRRNLPYDTVKDFVPVIGLVQTSDVLVARGGLPVKSLQDLVALARTRPGALNYGSFGVGSAPHLDAEKLSVAAGIRMMHIPYKGGGELPKALLAGEIDVSFSGLTAVMPLIRQGQIRALAFGGPQRSPALPGVPTLAESGYNFDTGGWFGWLAPAATPGTVVDKLASEANRVLSAQAFREKYIFAVGLEPLNLQAGAFANLVRETREKYFALFKTIDIKLE